MNKKLRIILGLMAGIFSIYAMAETSIAIRNVSQFLYSEISDEDADEATGEAIEEESVDPYDPYNIYDDEPDDEWNGVVDPDLIVSDREEYRYETEAELVKPVDLVGMAKKEGSVSPFDQKKNTLLIYMNGSDLESDGVGSASDDIAEILECVPTAQDLNVVMLVGGTLDWERPEIPDEAYRVFYLEMNEMYPVCDMGEQNIGDPALLAGFLELGFTYFPADRTSIIFWNHGGGSIYGYGNDELTGDGLLLDELNSAFASGIPEGERLDFIGFDACLMGSLETACMLSPYADYLVASEEIEPSSGWDYSFLVDLNRKPDIDTVQLCRYIVDYYVEGQNTSLDYWLDTQATLSIVDLRTIGYLADAFDDFSEEIGTDMMQGSYNDISRARNEAKAFGVSSEPDACYDMVDIASLAKVLSDLAPEKSGMLISTLEEVIIYSSHNDNIEETCGLSVYFPFESKSDVPDAIAYYEEMEILPAYTDLIGLFSEKLLNEEFDFSGFSSETPAIDEDGNFTVQLTEEELKNMRNIYFTLWGKEEELEPGIFYYIELAETAELSVQEDGTVTTQFDGTWTTLNGNWVCMYEIDRTDTQVRYAIPAYVNDLDVDIIVVYDVQNPEGKVAGARLVSETENNMSSKQMIEIVPGDEITLFYWAELFFDDERFTEDEIPDGYEEGCWYADEPWVVPEEGLRLEHQELDANDYLYGFALYDTGNNVHYTDFTEVEYR